MSHPSTSASTEPFYSLHSHPHPHLQPVDLHHGPDCDIHSDLPPPSPLHAHLPVPARPHDPVPLPSPPSLLSLRELPGPDILSSHRPSLSEFRASEGPSVRSAKLRALWNSIPDHLPMLSLDPETNPKETPTKKMQLPGQDTLAALSPERAERLRRLYQEELVKRVGEERPTARLWGGADDLEPEQKHVKGSKGIAWQDFR